MTATISARGKHSRMGPTGYGNGPVLAAGIMAGSAILAGAWGVAQMATNPDVLSNLTVNAAQAEPGAANAGGGGGGGDAVPVPGSTADPSADPSTAITLPDEDGDAVADPLEEPVNGGPVGGTSDTDGNSPASRTTTYVIEEGDTLSAISGATGVPLDKLVEANSIQNPNLIYAGAALLIPPM